MSCDGGIGMAWAMGRPISGPGTHRCADSWLYCGSWQGGGSWLGCGSWWGAICCEPGNGRGANTGAGAPAGRRPTCAGEGAPAGRRPKRRQAESTSTAVFASTPMPESSFCLCRTQRLRQLLSVRPGSMSAISFQRRPLRTPWQMRSTSCVVQQSPPRSSALPCCCCRRRTRLRTLSPDRFSPVSRRRSAAIAVQHGPRVS
mmetsp:Transcript_22634/g.72605  ORF Transcript_22634/g.72605 Transcript_22634/m.72605 type:complete len:201 (-) Transcript_22634:209-811(-)